MQKSFKLVMVDVILEFCQQTAEKVPNENHLGFQGAYNGEEDGFQCSEACLLFVRSRRSPIRP